MEGDLNDPQFRISDVIVGATGLAMKEGLTAYKKNLGATLLTGGLIPTGIFSIFGKIFSGATAMAFEPVIFKLLGTGLDGTATDHPNLVAEKLGEKPDVRPVMCGMVSTEDINALRQFFWPKARPPTVTRQPARPTDLQYLRPEDP